LDEDVGLAKLITDICYTNAKKLFDFTPSKFKIIMLDSLFSLKGKKLLSSPVLLGY